MVSKKDDCLVTWGDTRDHLSPLLFCIVEKVFSRGLIFLVRTSKLNLIKISRSSTSPSHILYVDDIMVFYIKKYSLNIGALAKNFINYAAISSHIVSPHNSTIYAGSISNHILFYLYNTFGLSVETFPFIYLGVPILNIRLKAIYFNQ